uniref:Peptidase M12B domain-containing protein n=1 Tax=Glossina brevipalpis TaxID=37001 RepID=A0A1A9WS33_9MUSC
MLQSSSAALTSSPPHHHYSFNTGANYIFPALDEFSTHSVIKPQIHHSKHKRAVHSTLDADGLHIPHIVLTYKHQGQNILIDLKRNDNLLPDKHFLRYQNNSNSTQGRSIVVVKNFTKTEIALCHYQGSIRDKPQTYVAVSTCNGGINGIVFDGIDTYFIHSGSDGQLHDEHLLFRQSDLLNKNTSCGYDHEHYDEKQAFAKNAAGSVDDAIARNRIDGSEFNRILRYKRSYDESHVIRGPFNSNKHSSYVELVMVVDNKAYKSFGENMKKVHQHCKDLANIINALYVPLNIFIALVGVVIWNESNEIEITPDADVTLRNFLIYRRTKLVLEHPNDNAQLLTKVKFEKGVVGKALKGPICTHEYSGSVSMEHSQIVAVVATTMAHELGHNFGMEHDSPDCKCQDEKCIMSASSTSVVPVHWSSCSIDQLNIAFSRGMNYCLRNKPHKLFNSPQCGNGFVEPGEQCDCGLPAYCENTCCDPHTCMLYSNASCATGQCCDLTTCRPKIASTLCRNAENECDLPEYCTGESEYCPIDVFKRDTEECDNGQAYCYQGNCRSHSHQCRILWGPTGENSEPCYLQMNTEGKRGGNCGFNRLNNTYIPCEKEHAACGMLHCRHLNERLEFGMESAAVLSHSFITHDSNIVPCRTALVDLGLQSTDPGLAPNGAKCGDQKMCVDQKCLSIEYLRTTGMGKTCTQNCNGNGVCNSRGNCHCNVGFTGSTCMMPGHGGSLDSGPATNPNSHEAFQRFMYIFFFAVIPFLAAFCFIMYYCRNHTLFMGGKLAENMYVSSDPKNVLSFSTSSNCSHTTTSVTHNFCTDHIPSSIKTANSRQPVNRINTSTGGVNQIGSSGLPKSTPSSTDDMNSALLKSPSDSSDTLGNGMFGKFKGFTLRPLNDAATPSGNFNGSNVAYVQPTLQDNSVLGIPQRAAPPPPVKQNDSKLNGTLSRKVPSSLLEGSLAPALPPPNPGSNTRPIISMPVLENSTLNLPLKSVSIAKDLQPNRPAPAAPSPHHQVAGQTLSILKPSPPPPVPLHVDPKLNVRRDGTIRRIASFLKKDDKVIVKEKTYIDREKLRNLEISAPMPVSSKIPPHGESSNSDSEATLTPKEEETKNLVKRAQSMRSPSKKSNIQTFGSMRQTSVGRPKSAVSSQASLNSLTARPKSPPPRPPPLKKTNSTTSSGYQLPVASTQRPTVEHAYDDCEVVKEPIKLAGNTLHLKNLDSDNIYAVIDEIPPAAQTLKRSDLVGGSVCSSIASSTDMGLLSEIVNEIEKRNGGDSMYSASTLVNAKNNDDEIESTKEQQQQKQVTSTNANITQPPATSYLRPTAVNAPIARIAPTKSDLSPTTAFSSFKPSPSNTSVATPGIHNHNIGKSNQSNQHQQQQQQQQQKRSNNRASSSVRVKNFNKPNSLMQKPTLPTGNQNATGGMTATIAKGLTTKPAATIQKPKLLSTKPSFNSNNIKKPAPASISTTTTTTPTTANATAARSVQKPSTVATLTQHFENPTTTNSTKTTTTTSSNSTQRK